MAEDAPRHPELARPYYERQAQYGRRVILAWSPKRSSTVNPLTVPWPLVDELIEGVEFASEAAARRYDLSQAVGENAWTVEDDGASWGPYFQFWTWEAAERWLYDQPGP
jgi:hypothetical protein